MLQVGHHVLYFKHQSETEDAVEFIVSSSKSLHTHLYAVTSSLRRTGVETAGVCTSLTTNGDVTCNCDYVLVHVVMYGRVYM